MALMGRLQSKLLDRNRPLWEIYFVDGLEGALVASLPAFDQLGVVRPSLQCAFDSVEHAGVEYPAVGSTGSKHESDSFSHRVLNHHSGSLIPA